MRLMPEAVECGTCIGHGEVMWGSELIRCESCGGMGYEPPWCATCGTQAVALGTSEETSGAMEAERQWLVTRLACGHTIETALR